MEARTNELKPFTNLASEMLSHLLIASMALHPFLACPNSSAQPEIQEGRKPLKNQ